jgi:hypothetical protein
MLMVTNVLAAKKAKAVGKSNINAVTATMAVVKTISSDEEMTTTAAVLPESSGEYNLHSDEDWDISCHKVSPQLHGKHLI